MRFGLIGCGWIVERDHIPAMLASDQVEIVATADVSADRARLAARVAGIPAGSAYSDYRALLERDDVDIVSVASPPGTRPQIITDAAAAGKHVVCEKPFALSLAAADEMIAACRAAGVTLAIYHNYLYYYEHRLAARLIAEGKIGDVVATEICGLGARPWAGAEQFRPGWRTDPALAGGGVLMDIGVHSFYLTELMHAAPARAVQARMRYMPTGVDDHAYCQLDFGAATGLVNIAWGEGTARFEIDGTAGYISYVYDEGAGYFGGAVRAVRVGTAEGPTLTHHVPPGRTQFTPELFADLVDTITGDRDAFCSFGPDGRRTLEIALAAYESADSGVPAALPVTAGRPVYAAGAVPLLESRKAAAHAG
ncbi:MAG TPA: Gfo/Idh/MocA family oxidoreductase [Streptosporangiaceae bacterium]|jgi:predicted dehydrogenase